MAEVAEVAAVRGNSLQLRQSFGLVRGLIVTSRERLTFDHVEHQQLTLNPHNGPRSRAFLRHQPQFIIFSVQQRSFDLL